MDALDCRILRTMGLDPWGPASYDADTLKPGFIAKQVGTTPETVRDRVQSMEDVGVIMRYEAYPNPRLFGMTLTSYAFWLEDDEQKARAIEQLRLLDDILIIHDFVGPVLVVTFAYRTDADLGRQLKRFHAATGAEQEMRALEFTPPPCDAEVTHLDWRIVQALRGDARRSLSDVAEDVGVTYRTVKRRLDRMMAKNVLSIIPVVDAGRVPGIVPMHLYFYLEEGAGAATVNAALKAFDDRLVARYVPATPMLGNLALLVFARTLAETEELRQRAGALPGVERAAGLLNRQTLELTAWLDDLVAQRVDETR